jgi:hypothetical protein
MHSDSALFLDDDFFKTQAFGLQHTKITIKYTVLLREIVGAIL